MICDVQVKLDLSCFTTVQKKEKKSQLVKEHTHVSWLCALAAQIVFMALPCDKIQLQLNQNFPLILCEHSFHQSLESVRRTLWQQKR